MSKNANRGKSSGRRDYVSYENVLKGNKTWVSKADLVSKWCLQADGGSRIGNSGGNIVMTEMATNSGSKGKEVKEVTDLDTNKVFMETKDGEIKQVQARDY
ncbi:hypothetical protein DVH24_004550 [Malus domestica]|uniref:Uncharacterized protein n=1 Tax=Malus domestica TaxID=3750 RepID=A0A498IB16_MALDO|nr:hypothetical protein DVH24_004550 [Malus domestica]